MSDTAHVTHGTNVTIPSEFRHEGDYTVRMLRLIDQTPTRAIFEERRPGLRIGALVCLGVTIFALIMLALQWRSAAAAYPERTGDLGVILGSGAFVVLLLIFGAASVYALLLSRRLTLTLDREAGDIVLVAPRGITMATEVLPYYGVKSVRLTGDASQKALALVFVLRDGRVVPVTAAPLHDRDRMEALAAQLRGIFFESHSA